jgi:hypothetical protein
MRRLALATFLVVLLTALSGCETTSMVTPWGPEVRTSWQGGFRYYSNLIVVRNDTPYPITITIGYLQKTIPPRSTTAHDWHGWGNAWASQSVSLLVTAQLPDGRTVSVTPSTYVDTYNRSIRTLVIEQDRWSGISYHW